MVKLLKIGPVSNKEENRYHLKINEKVHPLDKGDIYYRDSYCSITINDDKLTVEIIKSSIGSILYCIGEYSQFEIDLAFNFNINKDVKFHRIYIHLENEKVILSFGFEITNISHWKNTYSIYEYINFLKIFVRDLNIPGAKIELDDDPKHIDIFGITFLNLSKDNIELSVDYYKCLIDEIFENLEMKLKKVKIEHAVVSVFDFPEEIKVPCQQYLLYFVEFLKDLGIDATASIENKASDLLFSITPSENKNEVLDKIQKALEIYLQLPVYLGDANYYYINSDLKAQQLLANIRHLESQIILKDSIIKSQQIFIDQQKDMIDSTSVLIRSLKSLFINGSETEDKEELFDGILSLTQFEGKGFQINNAEIFRKVKKLLKID